MKKTILLIEDEPEVQAILSEELNAEGYRVELASNGQDGLERIEEIQPDLIICDRAMPVMSGYELLERIRSLYPQYKDIPFVFLTALGDARDKVAVVDLAPFAYLEKPIDFDLLHRTIRKAIPFE